MNGHCDFHTFERAVDVCDHCYGDVCRSCALSLKGRKDVVCKDCALNVSGVRRGGKPDSRGDRRTVKERRKRYAEEAPPEDFFHFFDNDLPDDVLFPELTEEGAEEAANDATSKSGGGIRRLFGRKKSNEQELIEGEDASATEVSDDDDPGSDEPDKRGGKDGDAVSRLADIRRQAHAAAASNPDDAQDQPDGDAAAIGEPDTSHVKDLPDDASVGLPAELLEALPDGASLGGASASSTASDATTAADQDQVAASPDQGEVDLSSDPFATAGEEHDGRPEGERRRSLQPVGSEVVDAPPQNPFLKQDGTTADAEALPDFSTDPFSSADPFSDADSFSDAGPGVESMVIANGRSLDDLRPTGSPETNGEGRHDPGHDLSGETNRESGEVGQRADTDARGSWIPPALRGIAPDAEEAADNLPRRRRR